MRYLKYFFVTLFLFGGAAVALGSVTSNQSTQQPFSYQQYTFFTATTTTATSTNLSDGGGYFIIKGAKKVVMYFTHGGTATTSTAGQKFTVQSTVDGTTWADFNKLIGADVSSTATSTYTILGATSTVPVALDLSDDAFFAVRCVSTEFSVLGTMGEATCTAAAEF
mgnify:FL=1